MELISGRMDSKRVGTCSAGILSSTSIQKDRQEVAHCHNQEALASHVGYVGSSNQVLHEEENAVAQRLLRQLDGQITATYQRLTTYVLAGSDKYLTKLSITNLLLKDRDYKKAWLLQATAVTKITRQSNWRTRQPQHLVMLGMRRTMHRWLHNSRRNRSI